MCSVSHGYKLSARVFRHEFIPCASKIIIKKKDGCTLWKYFVLEKQQIKVGNLKKVKVIN